MTTCARRSIAGAKLVLLDNFNLDRMFEAVILNARLTNRAAALEAPGGITLDNVRAVAETGVDRISVGQPHQGHALDIWR